MKKSALRQIIREEINKALPIVRKPLAIEGNTPFIAGKTPIDYRRGRVDDCDKCHREEYVYAWLGKGGKKEYYCEKCWPGKK